MAVKLESELSPQQQFQIADTVDLLRRIRQAGIIAIRETPGRSNSRTQAVLADAENLGLSASRYLITLPDEDPNLFEQWESSATELRLKYEHLQPYARYNSPCSRVLRSTEIDLSTLRINWQDFVSTRVNLINDHLKVGPEKLLDPSFGVFSPLSSDYLRFSLLHAHLGRLAQGEPFQLKPAILNPYDPASNECIFPVSPSGKRVFEDCQELTGLVDVVNDGDTRRVLLRSIKAQYPDKFVYGVDYRVA